MAPSTVSPAAKIPASSVVLPGAYIAASAEIGERVQVGPNATILGTPDGPRTRIEEGAEIGANAIVYAGVTVGARARVLPGAVIQRNIPPKAVVEGNPARITGYVDTPGRAPAAPASGPAAKRGIVESAVAGVKLHTFPLVTDIRGNLSVGEFEREIPFRPLRYFLVFDVPSSETRGEHAHRKCEQFLIAVKGSVSVVADDGKNREEFTLNAPNLGLHLPAMTWGIQYRYSADAVLLVFASDYYDAADYVRDYGEFLRLARA